MKSEMTLKLVAKILACSVLAFLWVRSGLCQTPPSPQSAGDLVSGIYNLVSSEGGNLPDWDKVRACFAPEAVIVLRTSRTAVKTFSVEAFIKDFVDFYERPFRIGDRTVVPKASGFRETVVRMSPWEYADMAHVLVLYEAKITADGARAQRGIDSWLLVRRDGRWTIAAVTNEILRAGLALPAALRETARMAQPTLEAAELQVEAVEERHSEALYTAARLHAGLDHREQAYRYLARTMAAGFNDRNRVLKDEAFQAFRDEDLFRSLSRKAWANGYIGLLERPNREDVQKSPQIMNLLAFRPGERVADIGAGSGYFTIPVARAVGPTGVVHALDVSPEMLEYLDFRIKSQKIENVRLRRVSSDNPRLEPASIDTVLMIDTIHYVKDRVAYAKKLRQGLAPGGRLVIIDYVPKPMSERPWGPLPEQQISRHQMDSEMAAAGFSVAHAYDFLPEQYFVVYKP
jgi:ubiquinone/menaquinone biosynthesis C-methylase UbiE